MVSNEYHFYFFIIQLLCFKVVDDLEACFVLIVPYNHLIAHWWSAGYINRQVIGVGCSENRNIPLTLRPCSAVGRMRMGNPTDTFPMFIKHGMFPSIRRCAYIDLYGFSFDVDNHHVLWCKLVIRNTTRFNSKNAFFAVCHTAISKSK